MKKEEVFRRLSLGAREWIDKTPIASAIFSFLFGKKVSESEILDKLTESKDDLDLAISKMENILPSAGNDEIIEKFNEIKVLLKKELKQKTLTIFCGPSSVGKDTIASELKLFIYAYYDYDIDYLKKYTTREPRAG